MLNLHYEDANILIFGLLSYEAGLPEVLSYKYIESKSDDDDLISEAEISRNAVKSERGGENSCDSFNGFHQNIKMVEKAMNGLILPDDQQDTENSPLEARSSRVGFVPFRGNFADSNTANSSGVGGVRRSRGRGERRGYHRFRGIHDDDEQQSDDYTPRTKRLLEGVKRNPESWSSW